jgi:hypothetical protein
MLKNKKPRLGNVMVTRTFSKAFGLANLRLGYAVGTDDTARYLSLANAKWATGQIAQAAGVAALADAAHLARTLATVREGRTFLVNEFTSLGFTVAPGRRATTSWSTSPRRASPRSSCGDGLRQGPRRRAGRLLAAPRPDQRRQGRREPPLIATVKTLLPDLLAGPRGWPYVRMMLASGRWERTRGSRRSCYASWAWGRRNGESCSRAKGAPPSARPPRS